MKTTVEKAILELKNDGIVVIPTETVYGLAGNAFSIRAVEKIYSLKNRPSHNPLIVHIASVDDLKKVVKDIPDDAYKLANAFWPGPLTLVLKKKEIIPDIVTSGLNTVAIRIPNHSLTLKLLKKLPFPLAAPSANPFGAISPTSPSHVLEYFQNQLTLDGGECERGLESTIVGFDESENPVIYRHGSIPEEEIREVVGGLKCFTEEDSKPNAPGMLSKHYAPKTPCCLTNDVPGTLKNMTGKKIGILLFKNRIADDLLLHQEILSEAGDFKEAAKNLYAAMHRLDKNNVDLIIFEQLPEKGLGRTINDKLRRAAKN